MYVDALLMDASALVQGRLQLNQGASALFLDRDRQGLFALRSPFC
jgi:hypothetical protein